MKDLIVATRNTGKLKEIKEILYGMPINIVSLDEIAFTDEIDETGSTFEENAFIKASEIFKKTGQMVMADDSGLEVDCLNGQPGIYSSRFASNDKERNNKLLGLLKDVPFEKRTARFVCAIAVIYDEGKYFTVRGTCEGYIGNEMVGENGFGYDPLFFIPEFNMTIAQMSSEQKNEISHRGKALRAMQQKLSDIENL